MATTLERAQHEVVLLPVVGETSRALDDRHRREIPALTPGQGRAAVKRLHEIAVACGREYRARGLHFEARVHDAQAEAYVAAFAALTGEHIR